ncbi:MAG: CHAT domain-containing protein [Candidatus Helarchaeota archaeon]
MSSDLDELMKKGNEALDKENFVAAKKYYSYGFDRSRSELNKEIFRYWYAYADYKLGNSHLALKNFLITIKNFDVLKKMEYPYEYNTYYNLARVYEQLGQWINVKQMLEKAIETNYVKQNIEKKYFVLWYLGDAHREREELEAAWDYYNQCKDYYKGRGKEKENHLLNLYIDIAKLQFKEGKIEESLELIETVWDQINLNDDYAYLRNPAAITYATLIQYVIENDIEDPIASFNKIKPILIEQLTQAKTKDSLSGRIEFLAWLSRLSSIVGDTAIFRETETFIEEVEPLKKTVDVITLDDIKNLIQIYIDLGDYYYDNISEEGPTLNSFKSLKLYRKADYLIDMATERIMSPTPRREFHVQFTDLAYRIFALYQMIYKDYWEDFLYEGLGTIEKYKGFDLFQRLESAGGRQKYLTQLTEIEYNIILKKRYLKKETQPTKRKQLQEEIDNLEDKYFDIENEMVTKYPQWLTETDPVKLMEETMGTLYPLIEHYKFGILYFAIHKNILYIIAFTKRDVQRIEVVFERQELESMKQLLHSVREKVNYLSSNSDFTNFNADLLKLSDWLSRYLVTPQLQEILNDLEYLTIIPSGFFINYPLEIVKIGTAYLGTKFKFSREFNLKFLAQQLHDIQRQKNNLNSQLDRLIGAKDVIFIGNPNFKEYLVLDKSDIELYVVGEDKIAKTEADYNARKAKNEEVYRETDCWLMDLGKTEVRDIIKLFKKKGIKYQSLIEAEVSKEKILNLLNNNLKIFHFAGHAVFDNENPQFSQLILRNSEVMTPPEFQKFKFLQNPLIVFSACESGVSEVKKGDEPFGFLRFTKIMGAQNIIFSLWPVFSEPTTKLMISFYEHLLDGHEIAEAMRYARARVQEIVENGEGLWFFKNFPILCWAPFSFIGFPFFNYLMEVPK